jgi:CheY-like chemotaxis protein
MAPMKILVVDDFAELRELIKIYLNGFGLVCDMAENGLAACEKALQESYGLIFMDIRMPVMNGIEAVAKLRQKGYEKPVVAITAHTNMADRERYLGEGFDDFLGKPFTVDDLKNVLEKFGLLTPSLESREKA